MRQLAAILFADMTGYTALMQRNEDLARLKRRRLKDVMESNVEAHNGKVLQYYGDGSLSIFSSVVDCLHCSIKIQQQLQLDPKVDLRMGVHTGDVIIEDESIYGDGVNMASRIESLAVSGGIFISEKVNDEIKNHGDFLVQEMGYFELKNVKVPVRIFAIANEGIAVPDRQDLKGKTEIPKNRLAILPFVNMSSDPDNEYFSDGMSEELMNILSRVDGLQVTSRTSSFAFKGKNTDIRDIAIQLNVDKILEGSVRKSGKRVRVTSQLINAADGYHIWSETYDRDLDDIFEVQDEISGIIANKLRENLLPSQKQNKLVKGQVKNIDAYTNYLKALHFWNDQTPAGQKECIRCCEQVIATEPTYAPAYALAASAYAALGSSGQMIPQKAFEIVHRYADKVLNLDKNLAEGYIAKATAHLLYDWKWQDAYNALQVALKLDPGAIEAYDLLGFYQVLSGQKELALKTLQQAEKLDPLSPGIVLSLGNMYSFNARFDDAIQQADKLLYLHPNMRAAIELKAWATGMKGDWETALKLFEEIHRLTNHPLKGLMGLGYAYTQLGEKEKAMECIRKMEQRQLNEPGAVIDADLAAVWAGLGDMDKTFYYVNQCIDKRMGPIIYFLEYPAFSAFKLSPQFSEVKKRMGII